MIVPAFKEKPMYSRLKHIVCFLQTLCIVVIAGGCTHKEASEHEFLRRVRTLVIINGNSIATLGGVEPYVHEAAAKGIDLFGSYKDNTGDNGLRLSMAYLLLGQESEPYVEYAEGHVRELITSHEFLLWAHVLTEADLGHRLSAAYRHKLALVLQGVDTPYAKVCVARIMAAEGANVGAVHRLLDVMAGRNPWRGDAWRALEQVSEPHRTAALLPYLKNPSARGAYAAAMLASVPQYRSEALKYLEDLKKSQDPDVALAGNEAMQDASVLIPGNGDVGGP
jgi:hypothetical protein